MWRLYIGPIHDVVRMVSVCGFRLGRYCTCHVRLDSHHRVSRHAPVIRRSIWSDLFYSSGSVRDHTCTPQQFCLCLYGEVRRAGVRLELSFCPGHEVVDQSHYVLMVRAQVPRDRIGVAVYTSDNFWLGAQGRIFLLTGHPFIYR